MKYSINESVIVLSSKSVKEIVDREVILGVELYYMSDNTSYSSEQLINIDSFLDDIVTPLFEEVENSFNMKIN
jgi:hypothetical protein